MLHQWQDLCLVLIWLLIMLLRVMFSKELSMFLFIGFVFVAYMNLPLLAVALLGVAIAVYDFQMNTRNVPQVKEADTDGI